MAVAVVIDKAASCAPLVSRGFQTGLLRHIGECSVAIVVIENVLAPVGHQQVRESVVVVVAGAAALRPAGSREARAQGHITESSVAVVMVEMADGSLTFWKSRDTRAVGQKNVRPAIAVVIEDNRAVPCGFNDEFFVFITAINIEGVQAGLAGDIFKVDGGRLYCLRFSRLGRRRLRKRKRCRRESRKQKPEISGALHTMNVPHAVRRSGYASLIRCALAGHRAPPFYTERIIGSASTLRP